MLGGVLYMKVQLDQSIVGDVGGVGDHDVSCEWATRAVCCMTGNKSWKASWMYVLLFVAYKTSSSKCWVIKYNNTLNITRMEAGGIIIQVYSDVTNKYFHKKAFSMKNSILNI